MTTENLAAVDTKGFHSDEDFAVLLSCVSDGCLLSFLLGKSDWLGCLKVLDFQDFCTSVRAHDNCFHVAGSRSSGRHGGDLGFLLQKMKILFAMETESKRDGLRNED